jgi:preprotein translocase subunit SecB
MAENNTAANGAAAPEATLTIQKLYVKDSSFEVPNAPQIFQEQAQPQVQLNLSQKVANFAENLYEVVLTVTVTCKVGDKTAYLAEVQQAGVFGLVGFPPNDLQQVLATYCPHTLYPYARQAIGNMILDGGFPPFNLQPINFEQMYIEQARRRAEGESEAPVANA